MCPSQDYLVSLVTLCVNFNGVPRLGRAVRHSLMCLSGYLLFWICRLVVDADLRIHSEKIEMSVTSTVWVLSVRARM